MGKGTERQGEGLTPLHMKQTCARSTQRQFRVPAYTRLWDRVVVKALSQGRTSLPPVLLLCPLPGAQARRYRAGVTSEPFPPAGR